MSNGEGLGGGRGNPGGDGQAAEGGQERSINICHLGWQMMFDNVCLGPQSLIRTGLWHDSMQFS